MIRPLGAPAGFKASVSGLGVAVDTHQLIIPVVPDKVDRDAPGEVLAVLDATLQRTPLVGEQIGSFQVLAASDYIAVLIRVRGRVRVACLATVVVVQGRGEALDGHAAVVVGLRLRAAVACETTIWMAVGQGLGVAVGICDARAVTADGTVSEAVFKRIGVNCELITALELNTAADIILDTIVVGE